MIWGILVLLSVYALHHGAEVWAAAVGSGLVFLVVYLNANENTTSAVPLKQALCRAFKITRALRGLIVVAALVIVNSACMLLAGWWQEWLACSVEYRDGERHGEISKMVLMTITAIASPLPWRPATLARRHQTPRKTTLSTTMAIQRIGST